MTTRPDWQDVLDFWFLAPCEPGHLRPRQAWFQKSAAFDAEILSRFGAQIDVAVAGGLRAWDAHPEGTLARILLLDQFTRNVWRGTARAFSGDALARAAAQRLVATGLHLALRPVQRVFAYLPFEHAEDLVLQRRCVALYQDLARVAGQEYKGYVDYAERHRDVIARFGRFPHRNAQLGRPSTDEELAFLTQPGSSF
ncbi:FIG027190: Putative transmembrane protein [plant metagenome]|uniref:FIG027190: Putative transmembrane protein n=1 Tax=plant metagenome TaxID=1297885 RepID=A0A484U8J6_9ZZZZ